MATSLSERRVRCASQVGHLAVGEVADELVDGHAIAEREDAFSR